MKITIKQNAWDNWYGYVVAPAASWQGQDLGGGR